MERSNLISFSGKPLTLTGTAIKVSDTAPNFTAMDTNLKPINFSDLKGENIVISSVPSLDTPVCEMQTKKFNSEAAILNIKILTISMDLPFAQKRFCDSFNIGDITLLSDYKDRDFGQKYGLLIKELGLLARAVIIVDAAGKINYLQLVKELTTEPNYDEVLEAIKNL